MFSKKYYDMVTIRYEKINEKLLVSNINDKWKKIFPNANMNNKDPYALLKRWYVDAFRFWLEDETSNRSESFYKTLLKNVILHQSLIEESSKYEKDFLSLKLNLNDNCVECSNSFPLCQYCKNTYYFFKVYFFIYDDEKKDCVECTIDATCNNCKIQNNYYTFYKLKYLNNEQSQKEIESGKIKETIKKKNKKKFTLFKNNYNEID